MPQRRKTKTKKYATKASQAVKKIDKEDLASVPSFIRDTTSKAGKAAFKSVKKIKRTGAKDLAWAKSFVKKNPVKSGAYAIGMSALLSYFLFRRK